MLNAFGRPVLYPFREELKAMGLLPGKINLIDFFRLARFRSTSQIDILCDVNNPLTGETEQPERSALKKAQPLKWSDC
jgi:glycerate kinase